MKFLVALGFCISGSIAVAQVQFIDTPAVAHLLRDRESSAIMISGNGAQQIDSFIKDSLNQAAPVTCKAGYCVIGQISRRGRLSSLGGAFAESDFFAKVLKKKTQPNGLVDSAWFTKFAGETAVYPTQCQTPNYRPMQSMEVSIEGIPAEQLYNFLSVPKTTSGRSTSVAKESIDHVFSCEKISNYDMADIGETGNIPDSVKPSYAEYRCTFRILKTADLALLAPCSIYGASSSAGGGR